MSPYLRRFRAFTLLELVLAVVVLSVLAAFAIPNFERVRSTSRGETAEATLAGVLRAATAADGFNGGTLSAAAIAAAAAETDAADRSGPLGFVLDDGSLSYAAAASPQRISAFEITDGYALALGFTGGCALARVTSGAEVTTWHLLGNGFCAGSAAKDGPSIPLPDAPESVAPGPVRMLDVSVLSETSVLLTFASPATDGGSPVDAYRVDVSAGGADPDAQLFPVETLSFEGGSYTITLTGLSAGASYTFEVFARNAIGFSSMVSSGSVELDTDALEPPTTPGDADVLAGDGAVTLTWSAPTSTPSAPLTGYRIYQYAATTGLYELLGSTGDTSFTVSGLVNGTEYRFRVAAYGDGGESALSDVLVSTPVSALPAPAGLVAAATPGQVNLDWNPVSAAPLTGYRVYQYSPILDAFQLIGSANDTAYVVAGLSNGSTYRFYVTAYNPNGEGLPSTTVEATPLNIPASVSDLTASANASTATFSWSAVESTAAAPVLGYRVYRLSALTGLYDLLAATAGTSYTATGLSTNTTYSFAVAAYGPAGEGTRVFTTASTHTAAVAVNADRLGLVNYFGTRAGTVGFSSPNTSGEIVVTGSSALSGTAFAYYSVDQAVSDFHTGADGVHWARYDFGTSSKVYLDGYSIRQRYGASMNLLRSWVVEGSNNASDWTTLHTGSTTAGQHAWHDHSLTSPDTVGYRYLRVRLAGPTSSNDYYLTYSEIEFYGSVTIPARTPIVTGSLTGDAPTLTITPSWGPTPTSYQITRDGSVVDTVSASGTTSWTDGSNPLGIAAYTVVAVAPPGNSAPTAATYPSATTMPVPAVSHVGNVQIGSKIYQLGGLTVSGTYVSTVRSYDMATGTWTTLASMPAAFIVPFAAANEAGTKIVVAGGYVTGSVGHGNIYVYDIAANTWSTLPGAGTTVFNSNAGVRVGDDLYLFGGHANGNFGQSWKLNLNSYTWTRLADISARQNAFAVSDGAGNIYVGGGTAGSTGNDYATFYRYSIASNTFTTLASLPYAAAAQAATYLPNGKALIAGGYRGGTGTYSNRVDIYDPVTNLWSQFTTLPLARTQMLIGVHGGRVYLIGGYLQSATVTDQMLSFRY